MQFKSVLLIVLFFLYLLAPPRGYSETKDSLLEFLEKLSNAHGASGFEEPIRKLLQEEWKPLLAEMNVDGMGNLIGAFSSSNSQQDQQKPRILLMAHMDEVGFLVREITPEGFIRFDPAGSWLDPVLLAQEWVITTPRGPVKGVTGAESIHIADPDSVKALPSQKLFIDVGAQSAQEAISWGIRPGLPITPATKFTVINQSQRYLGKALDDRVGLVVITEVLKKISNSLLPNTLLVAATTQEEVGARGAEVLYLSIHPDLVINIDVGLARDFLSLFSFNPLQIGLGRGTSLFVYDKTLIPNPKLVDFVIATAKQKQIPLQFDVGEEYSEDGARLQISGKGIPVVTLGIPVRYPHSHIGMIDRSDIDSTIKLIVELVNHLTKSAVDQMKPT